VKILRVDPEERKIGLSRKRVEWGEEESAADEESTNGAGAPAELKGGIGSESGPLFKPAAKQEVDAAESADAAQADT
jgi:small subunit ribosomal protein S1